MLEFAHGRAYENAYVALEDMTHENWVGVLQNAEVLPGNLHIVIQETELECKSDLVEAIFLNYPTATYLIDFQGVSRILLTAEDVKNVRNLCLSDISGAATDVMDFFLSSSVDEDVSIYLRS